MTDLKVCKFGLKELNRNEISRQRKTSVRELIYRQLKASAELKEL